VIRHHNPCIEQNSRPQFLAPLPFFRHNAPDIIQDHPTTIHFAEEALTALRAGRDEVRSDTSVVE
jgi:hypothetical protein